NAAVRREPIPSCSRSCRHGCCGRRSRLWRAARRTSSPPPTSAASRISAAAPRCRCVTGSSCSRRDLMADQWGERMPRSVSPLPAFLFGWTELIVIRAAALGAIATIFAEYLGYFVPLSAVQVRYTAALAIVLIGAINYLGVQRAAALLSATTALKYLVLAALG